MNQLFFVVMFLFVILAPFVTINCGAIPKDIVEAELFGYARGAFTGAVQPRPGKIEMADGGTLFLDEIGELPLEAQVKLLRVLQQGEISKIGAGKMTHVNVRVVATTHRDLTAMIEDGTFREDLYYRLAVVPLFCRRCGSAVRIYPSWSSISPQSQGAAWYRGCSVGSDGYAASHGISLAGNVRELELFEGNKTHAAKYLDINRRTLIYRMEKYGIAAEQRARVCELDRKSAELLDYAAAHSVGGSGAVFRSAGRINAYGGCGDLPGCLDHCDGPVARFAEADADLCWMLCGGTGLVAYAASFERRAVAG